MSKVPGFHTICHKLCLRPLHVHVVVLRKEKLELFFLRESLKTVNEKESHTSKTSQSSPWLHFKETLESPAIKYLIYLSLNSTDTLCLTHHE